MFAQRWGQGLGAGQNCAGFLFTTPTHMEDLIVLLPQTQRGLDAGEEGAALKVWAEALWPSP